VFSYIQEFWGLITPGAAVVFLAGLFWRRASATGAAVAMALTLPVTIGIKLMWPGMAFLNQMWIAGLLLFGILAVVSLARPQASAVASDDEPLLAPHSGHPEQEGAPAAMLVAAPDRLFDALCAGVVILTVALYVYFF
jgi:Na+/proline symporter